MSAHQNADSMRADLAKLESRIRTLDSTLEQEQRILAILEKEFPVDPSWATESKATIRATLKTLTAERSALNVQAVEIAVRLPVAVKPMEPIRFKKNAES